MTTSSRSIPKHGSPSFFKVIRDPSSPHLMLPSAFVRRHMKKIPKNPILKTVTGEHSWRLKIEKIDGDYCFAIGWNKLVQDFNLCLGDFLVFWLIDSSTFKVLIFHRDGCEKDPNWEPGINIVDDDDDDDEDGDDELDDDDEEDVDYVDDGIRDENPCFQRAISEKTHKYTMRLPRVFVVEAGIKNKSVVTIKDLEGREWLVGLFVERYNNNKYILASGWSIFREYNKLSEGDICLFKFIKKEGVLYLAQLIKNKNARKEEIRERKTVEVDGVKRKRGRPPLEKPRGSVNDGVVKIEDESDLEVEVVKRKRGRPPLEKCGGGVGVVVNTQMDVEKRKKDKSTPEKCVCDVGDGFNTEMEVEKRKRGMSSPEKRGDGGGGGVNTEVEVEKRKRGRPPLEKREGGGGGDDGGVNPEMEMEKRKRERPPLEKGGSGVGDGVDTEVEVEKRKRGRPPLKKRSGGGDGVKTEVEVEKRKRGRPPLEKRGGGGGVNTEIEAEKKKRDKLPLEKPHVDVKVKDESSSDIEVIKRKRGRPSLKKPCVEVKIEDESTSDVEATRRKRGRPRLDSYNSSNRVIYF